MHPNHQIYNRSLRILEEYFQPEEDAVIGGPQTIPGAPLGGQFNF